MSRKIICDRCRVKEGAEKQKDTPWKKCFVIDLCPDCDAEVSKEIQRYILHREIMDEHFRSWLYNPQPGALEAIMGKFGYPSIVDEADK